MDGKDSIVGGDPFKRSSYFWEKKASQMLNLITGTGSSGSPKRSSASAAASTGAAGSPAPASGSSIPLNGSNDTITRGSSSPGLSKRRSGTPTPETVAAAISASGPDRIDGTRSSSPGPSKSSQKAFRFSLPQNAGDLMGVPTQEKPERSPRNRPGYESDSRAQRKRSNSQLLTGLPNAIVALASSPKSKKRSNSVSSNPSSIKSDGKRKSASDLKNNTSRSGSKTSISTGPISPLVTSADRNRSESASSMTGDLVSAELVFSLQTTVAALTEQISSLQTALASEKQERELLQTKVLDQERSISTLADAVQRQVSLLEHFRAELDSMKKLNASSSQNGTLATSTSEDAATLLSRSSTHALGTESVEEDSLPRPSRHRSSSKLKTDVAVSSDSSRDQIRDAAGTNANHGSPRKSSKDKSRKTERKSSARDKISSRAESAYESDSTPARARRRVNSAETSSRSAVSSGAIESASAISTPGSDSKAIISRSRSQTLHEKQSSDTSVSKKPMAVRPPSKSADSVTKPSKISIKSPKSRSSMKLDAPSAAESTETSRKTEVEFGGVEYARTDSKPKVRRPASTTFGIEVLRRASEKDLDHTGDDSHGSPVTSPKPRNRSKSSRANKLLEQMTPAEQAETATATLAANVASPPASKSPKEFTSPRQDGGLLSRSGSSSEEMTLFKKKHPATPAPLLSVADKSVSSPTSRRGSFSEITSPKFDFSNRPFSELEAPAESDESVGANKSAYGESDASSGADDSKAKQIIRKVNIFAVGARSFGVPLSQCQLDERASVPVVLATLANTLKNERPLPADIFDRTVDATKVDALRKRIESATQSTVLRDTDIYLVAALLKRFFMELPEALLTAARRKSWLQVADIDDDMVRVPAIRSLFHGLDRVNRKVLEYVVIFFNRLIDTSNGQLNLKQIASTFGPIFMRPTVQNPAIILSPQTAPTSANRIDAVRRENSSIAVDSSATDDFGDLTPDDVLEEKSITLLAVFMRQYPNIFLLKCPGIEFHKRTYHVKAATVDNFVGLMLDSNYIEREFHDIFWSTYPYFIDSDDLLMRFTDLFYEYNALTRWESRYRMKVLFILKLWIRRLGPALEHNSAFREDLAKFIDEALRRVENAPDDSLEKPMLLSLQNVKFSATLDSEGSMIVSRILASANPSSSPSANVVSPRLARSPSKKRLLSSRGAPVDVLQLDPKSLAFQITLIDYKLVHMIGSSELISGNSMTPEKSPNYTAMVHHINRITHWVAFEILSRSSSTERARVLSFFIDVAYYCRKMCNFNGSWAVFGAFGLHPVSRLTQTWERLPRRDAGRHKKLTALFEPRMNFSEYRKQLDRALHEGSCVPILAFLPKDIIRFETDPTFTEDRLVDFDKMRGIYQTLQLLSHCQNESGVPAGKVEELWDLLLGLPDFDEDELDSLSRKVEPRK